jgi:hypothetical protein
MPLLDQNLYDCSDDLCDILENISKVLEAEVVVDDYEGDWVNFRVIGMTDRCAIHEIDQWKHEILGADLPFYAIRASSARLNGEGLWIQELEGNALHEYKTGPWLY